MRRERVERSHERPHPGIVADDRRLRFARMRALYCTGRSNKRNAGTRFNGLKTCVPYRSGFIDCSPATWPYRYRIDGDTSQQVRDNRDEVNKHAMCYAATPFNATSPHAPAASASTPGSSLHCPSKPKNIRTPSGDMPANTDGATLSRKHA